MASLESISNTSNKITEDDLFSKVDAIQKEQQLQRWMIIALAVLILMKK